MIGMVTEEMRHVGGWLKSRWSVIAPEDWLEACLQWLHDDNQGPDLRVEAVKKLVYEQWLLSDLREIGARCLPQVALQQQTFTLTGKYCLQMESVVDVSSPFYGQLQKLSGTENSNVQVSASTQYTQREARASRMLMMRLTDGEVSLRGMEYESIPCLSVSTTPGTKLLVHGSVLCRLGVLMLKRDNVLLLGGEVESLVEQHSQQRVLSRSLGQNEELGQQPPRTETTTYDADPVTAGHRSATRGQHQPASHNPAVNTRGQHPPTSHNPAVNSSRPESHTVEPEFDEIPDDDLLDNMDTAQLAAMEQENWDDDDFDYDQVMNDHESLAPGDSAVSVGPSAMSNDTGYEASEMEVFQTPANISNSVLSNISCEAPGHSSSVGFERNSAVRTSAPTQGSMRHSTSTDERNSVRLNNSRDNVGSGSASTSAANLAPKDSASTDRNGNAPNRRQLAETNVDESQNDGSFRRPAVIGWNAATSRAVITDDGAREGHVFIDHSNDRPRQAAIVAPMVNYSQSVLGADSEPFTYLSKVGQFIRSGQPTTFKVKAFISTLLSKLESGDGAEWSLRVKLNDGTATLDCDVSDEMISSLMMFTAAEMITMRDAGRKDKAARQRLTKALRSFQQRLIEMNSVLTVTVYDDRPLPVIGGPVTFTSADRTLLERRVLSALDMPSTH